MVAPAGAAAAEEQAPRPPRFPGASQAHWACDLRRRNRQAQTVDIDELMKRAPLDFYAFLHFATYLGLGFVK